jgi:hypothetical protein
VLPRSIVPGGGDGPGLMQERFCEQRFSAPGVPDQRSRADGLSRNPTHCSPPYCRPRRRIDAPLV